MRRYSIRGSTAAQVANVGGTVVKEAVNIGIVFATLTEAQVARLRALGCTVEKIEKVKPTVITPIPVSAAPIYTATQLVWAAGYEDLRAITDPPLYGEGFNLAIIDTGIRETHEKINGHVIYRKNYTSDPMRDGFNHGTGICSIALAVAPLCSIVNMKVLDDNGEGTEEEVVLALDDCIALQDSDPGVAPHVVNLSLGTPDVGNPNDALRTACRAVLEKGIWIFAAAGNDGPEPGTVLSPACERYVGCVGSIKYEPFIVSSFSSRGPTVEGFVKPDALLFGEDIQMASSVGDTATIAKSGTSFSVPFASAMALIYHEGMLKYHGVAFPGTIPAGVYPQIDWMITIEELLDVYLGGLCIKPEGVALGKDNNYGYGMPFGTLIAKGIGVAPTFDISSIMAAMVAIGMLGMVSGIAGE